MGSLGDGRGSSLSKLAGVTFTLQYGTLRYVTIRYITVIFNAFSFVCTVDNKKQREQDCTSDESKHSEKPSRVVDRSTFNLPRT